MPVKVMIPTPLRAFTDKLEAVELEGKTVAELLENLTEKYQPLRKHLFNDEGKLRNFVNGAAVAGGGKRVELRSSSAETQIAPRVRRVLFICRYSRTTCTPPRRHGESWRCGAPMNVMPPDQRQPLHYSTRRARRVKWGARDRKPLVP